tara:strand:+ start:1329 stop:1703 length:375 start_codon:yes stop_codon:yes gene_type:complete
MPPKINSKYVPKGLTPSDRKKQIKSIKEGTDRPKVNYKTKRSSWVVKFEKKYNRKITDLDWISKNLLKRTGINKVLSKGSAAYYSSGSRPNVSVFQWKYARLASVLLNGPARRVDKNEWEKYKI